MSYSSEVLADSPLIYWRLGEGSGTTAVDASGNAHDGTYNNTPTLAVGGALAGDSDTAVTFTSASSEDVRVASFAGLNITTFTLEAWVKTTGSNQAILGRQGGTSVPYSMFVDASGFLQIVIRTSGTSGTNYSDTSGTVINDGAWHHIAVVRDAATSNTVYFYIDGVQKSSVASTATPNTGTSVGFAAASRGTTPFLNGSIDEAALYTTAVSATRITAHYNAGTSTSVTGTLASTLDDASLAGSGAETFTGTLASTLDDATLSATSEESFTGTLATTLGDTTLAASGAETISATLAATLEDATLAAAGTESFAGALATTLDDATVSASGSVGSSDATGTLAATLDDATLGATGAQTFTGTATTTLGDATLHAVASESMTGTFASTLDDATMTSLGSLTIGGTLAVTLDGAQLAAIATEVATGTLAVTLADVVMTAVGLTYDPSTYRDIVVSVSLEPSTRVAALVASPYSGDVAAGTRSALLASDPRAAEPEPATRTAQVEAT